MRPITRDDIEFNVQLVTVVISYDEFVGRFGLRHSEHPEDWDAAGPVELWFFELPWGHKLTLEYQLAISVVNIYMECLERSAVLNYIGLEKHVHYFNTALIQVATDRYPISSCRLLRQDDNGNIAVMHTYESRRVADYYQKLYEARGHKQLYWVEQGSED